MNYYENIKTEILNNEITKKVKDFSTLRYMRQFYENGIHQAVPGELTWSH